MVFTVCIFQNAPVKQKKKPKRNPQQCHYCNKFISGGKLLRHLRTVHKNEFLGPQKASMLPAVPVASVSANHEVVAVEAAACLTPITFEQELSHFGFKSLHELLDWFKSELQRPSRQSLNDSKANDYIRLVKALLLSSQSLWNPDKIFAGLSNVRTRIGKRIQPGTRYTTLTAFKRLISYLLQERCILESDEKLLRLLSERIAEWQPKISREKRTRQAVLWKSDNKNMEKLDFSLAFRQDVYQKYRDLISDPYITDIQKLQVRSYILLRIISENASRNSEIRGICISDVEDRIVLPGDKNIQLTIASHKTDQQGCAFIDCTVALIDMMKRFAPISREWNARGPHIPNGNSPFFVTSTGQPLTASNIVSSANSLYKKLGGEGHFTPTISRKHCARLTAKENDLSLQQSHAKAMNHSLSTHQRYYGGKIAEAGVKDENLDTQAKSSRLHAFLLSRRDRRSATETRPSTSECYAQESEKNTDTEDGPEEYPAKRGRQEYTESDITILRESFATFFEPNNTDKLTIAIVRQVIEQNSPLQALVKERCASDRQIYDKVRKMRYSDD